MGYLLLTSMLLVTVMGQTNISQTQKEPCRNVNYQVNHLHQTYSCGNNGSGYGMAIEDIKTQLASLQAKVEKITNNKGPVRSCPDRFTVRHKSSCYYFVPAKVDWLTAYFRCQMSGAQLVSIETQEENAYIRNYIKKTRPLASGDFWTSGMDHLEEGAWFWAGNLNFLAYSDWHPGQPGGTTDQNCIILHKPTGWNWHDAPCTSKFGYICEASL